MNRSRPGRPGGETELPRDLAKLAERALSRNRYLINRLSIMFFRYQYLFAFRLYVSVVFKSPHNLIESRSRFADSAFFKHPPQVQSRHFRPRFTQKMQNHGLSQRQALSLHGFLLSASAVL